MADKHYGILKTSYVVKAKSGGVLKFMCIMIIKASGIF